ncbi:MAG: dihydrolipoyl dehydrogenase family protein [Gammaproteobacteria bacterium]
MKTPEFDLCVIGGGAGGLVVAAGGASLGAKVALIEKNALGGDCLHYGCVPSKTLLNSAKVANTMRDSQRFGITPHHPEISLPDIMQRVSQVIKTIEVHDSPDRFRAMGIDVIFGAGQFTSPSTFEVNGRTITARHFVIATGSRPAIPSIDGINNTPYLTNETIFSSDEPVPHLLVLGTGPIGLEMAQAFSRLGSDVTVVQRGTRILPKEDHDLADVVKERLKNENIRFYQNNNIERIEGSTENIRLTFTSKENNQVQTIKATHLLVATGRKSNVDNLGLDAAGIEVEHGHIVTDDRLRTSNRRIFACGDITGSHQFTHMAEHHAGIVLRNTLFRLPAKIEKRVIPWCTFTDPELARVGLSEEEARQQKIDYRCYKFPFEDIDRAQTDGDTTGFGKIITNKKGRLLGAALVGSHAGELIHEYTLALAMKMKASDLSGVIHIYPTLAQINHRISDERMKKNLTPLTRKWIKRIFRLRGN